MSQYPYILSTEFAHQRKTSGRFHALIYFFFSGRNRDGAAAVGRLQFLSRSVTIDRRTMKKALFARLWFTVVPASPFPATLCQPMLELGLGRSRYCASIHLLLQ